MNSSAIVNDINSYKPSKTDIKKSKEVESVLLKNTQTNINVRPTTNDWIMKRIQKELTQQKYEEDKMINSQIKENDNVLFSIHKRNIQSKSGIEKNSHVKMTTVCSNNIPDPISTSTLNHIKILNGFKTKEDIKSQSIVRIGNEVNIVPEKEITTINAGNFEATETASRLSRNPVVPLETFSNNFIELLSDPEITIERLKELI